MIWHRNFCIDPHLLYYISLLQYITKCRKIYLSNYHCLTANSCFVMFLSVISCVCFPKIKCLFLPKLILVFPKLYISFFPAYIVALFGCGNFVAEIVAFTWKNPYLCKNKRKRKSTEYDNRWPGAACNQSDMKKRNNAVQACVMYLSQSLSVLLWW